MKILIFTYFKQVCASSRNILAVGYLLLAVCCYGCMHHRLENFFLLFKTQEPRKLNYRSTTYISDNSAASFSSSMGVWGMWGVWRMWEDRERLVAIEK